MIVTKSNIQDAFKAIGKCKKFVIDVESTGLDPYNDDMLCGIGIQAVDGIDTQFYFPFRHSIGENIDISALKYIFKMLHGKALIGHNVKFDVSMLHRDGFDYNECLLIDTLVMVRLCSIERYPAFNLDKCIKLYLDVEDDDYKKDIKKYLKSIQAKKFSDGEVNVIGEYCCNDVKYTKRLFDKLHAEIVKTKQVGIWKQDCKLTKVLLNMEDSGILIDREYCKRSIEMLDKELNGKQCKIHALAGYKFNIRSSKQKTEFFNSIGLHSPIVTSKGNESWSQKALLQIDHPIASDFIEYNILSTLNNTFFVPIFNKGTRIIHAMFKNWATITGRLSCANPNLQNQPVMVIIIGQNICNDEFTKNVVKSGGGGRSLSRSSHSGDSKYDDNDNRLVSARRLFINRHGMTLFSFDYSQMEVAVMLYYAGEKDILYRIGNLGFDFHAFIAKEAFACNEEDSNFKLFRNISKGITFGVIYGMGNDTLSRAIGKSIDEAIQLREAYFNKVPKVKAYMDGIKANVEVGNMLYNAYGRRYSIPISQSYLATNYMIQGTAGDLIKEVMINIDRYLSDKKSNMLIQIHDELLFEIQDDEMHIIDDIAAMMKNNKLGIPLNVKVKKCMGSWANEVDYYE